LALLDGTYFRKAQRNCIHPHEATSLNRQQKALPSACIRAEP
jgi:hypothetical protein